MPEDAAEMIIRHLADEGRTRAERGNASRRIARAAARDLDRRIHETIEALGLFRIDEPHRALHQRLGNEKIILGGSDHVDNGIANRQDIELRRVRHGGQGLFRQMWSGETGGNDGMIALGSAGHRR